MSCPELERLLAGADAGNDTAVIAVNRHANTCLICQDELQAAQAIVDQWPLTAQRDHLTTEQITVLAEYAGTILTLAERATWQHALTCAACRDELAHARGCVIAARDAKPVETAEAVAAAHASAAHVLATFNRRLQRTIVLLWVGSVLKVRSGRQSSAATDRPHARGTSNDTGDAEVEETFGAYRLTVAFLSTESPQKARLELHLSSSSTEYPIHEVVASLTPMQVGQVPGAYPRSQTLTFHDTKPVLYMPPQLPGTYTLTLTSPTSPTGQRGHLIGAVNVQISVITNDESE